MQLEALGVNKAVAMTADVKDQNQLSAAAAHVRREFGNVTMLFNNAGISGPLGRCWEMDLKDQEVTLQVNFMSHFYTLHKFLPWMVQNNRGHVIATCSGYGFCYANNLAPYVAAKHVVLGYYSCLKEDLRVASSSVRVSLVYPGIIRTNMTAPLDFHFKSLACPILTAGTSATSAGQQIVDGVVLNKANIYVPRSIGVLHCLTGIFTCEIYSSIMDFIGFNHLDLDKCRTNQEEVLKSNLVATSNID